MECLRFDANMRLKLLDTDCQHVRLSQVDGPELWALEITTARGVIQVGIFGQSDWEPVNVNLIGQARSLSAPRQEA